MYKTINRIECVYILSPIYHLGDFIIRKQSEIQKKPYSQMLITRLFIILKKLGITKYPTRNAYTVCTLGGILCNNLKWCLLTCWIKILSWGKIVWSLYLCNHFHTSFCICFNYCLYVSYIKSDKTWGCLSFLFHIFHDYYAKHGLLLYISLVI